MPRPHGLPRWVLLTLACAALVAVAMIPRGVVRTIEASHLDAPAIDAGDQYRSPEPGSVELPGVRAVVSREERELVLVPAALGATVPGDAAAHHVDPTPPERRDDTPAATTAPPTAPTGSRAPPSAI